MITPDEARALAAEHNFEKSIKAAASRGAFQTTLIFSSEKMANDARDQLVKGGFICTRITAQYTREGTDYKFDAKWD